MKATPTLRLMADYGSWPLWANEAGKARNVNPNELAISEELQSRLREWQKSFDYTLNTDDPAASGFARERDLHAFQDEGKELCALLNQELRGLFEVEYFSHEILVRQGSD